MLEMGGVEKNGQIAEYSPTIGIAQHIHKVVRVESPGQETTPTTIVLLLETKTTRNGTRFSDAGAHDTNITG